MVWLKRMSQRVASDRRGLSMIGIAVAIVILTLVGAGGFLYFRYTQLKASQAQDTKIDVLPPGTTILLADFPVNISGPDSDYIYKVEIKGNIVYPDDTRRTDAVVKEIQQRKAQIEDLINELLARQRYSELTREGPAVYKQELLTRINSVLQNGEIRDLYITGIIVPMN